MCDDYTQISDSTSKMGICAGENFFCIIPESQFMKELLLRINIAWREQSIAIDYCMKQLVFGNKICCIQYSFSQLYVALQVDINIYFFFFQRQFRNICVTIGHLFSISSGRLFRFSAMMIVLPAVGLTTDFILLASSSLKSTKVLENCLLFSILNSLQMEACSYYVQNKSVAENTFCSLYVSVIGKMKLLWIRS